MAYDDLKTQLPLLELDLLKTIVAIAETGNFSSAGEEVFRTPSAVSMQVKRVEEMLGRSIFIRDSRSVTPTADGEKLLEHGRRVLAMNNQLVRQFVQPDITDVAVDDSEVLAQRVRNGEIDVALINCNLSKKLSKDIEVVFKERLIWAGAENGVAYEQTPLPVSVWEDNCSWRKSGLSSLKERGIEYRVAFTSARTSGQRAVVLADLAVAPLPASCCINGIVPLSEEDGLPTLPYYGIGMLVKKDATEPALAAAQHLRDSLKLRSET